MYGKLSTSLLAEFIGTFALIFIGAGAGALGLGGLVGVAFAHGLVVIAFAYSYGHISGTHINPAVTLGVFAAGKIDAARAFSYIVFQILGGIVGAFALRWVLGGAQTGLGATTPQTLTTAGGVSITITPIIALVVEAILTFFLVNTVMNAGVSGKATPVDGLAVGFTLVFCILMGGPLTGASLNPARTIGPALAADNYRDLWVYLVGPALGGIAAGLLYKLVYEARQEHARKK
ncbi:MAG TPA: aquaporin [Thermoanaerobaculia bacterium]|nr:aquaporin [Thermoanaerobaculia bacterium]